MLKLRAKSVISLFVISTLFTCIDPYVPKLKGYDSLLVVDGLITDANSSYSIKLTRTSQDVNSIPAIVSDATVSVSDDVGNTNFLNYSGNGVYKSDSTTFRGTVGRTYVLHITTPEEEEFTSEPCLMQSVPDIYSIYFARDEELTNNGTENQSGVRIYLNSKGNDINKYYRWTFDETWKFKVPNPKLYDYVHTQFPMSPVFTPVSDVKEFCWKFSKSNDILIRSINEGQSNIIEKQPIYFIPTEKSDRLLIQYSILVKQYSISKNEFDFWNNLKQINETGGDIFARQPYSVLSNINSVNNSNKRVLGFFQVSAVSQKRKYILKSDVSLMGLHFYEPPCKTWVLDLSYFPPGCLNCPPWTWDDLYSRLCISSNYTFTEPIHQGQSDVLLDLVFTTHECANCELTGTHTKPDFWIDL
jgi:hypothetical protein